ncbi:MAG: hypothetical protein H6Q68_20 [Firmicutes bacterium]|nr:hypothetical protein [Bacillota bacterium]
MKKIRQTWLDQVCLADYRIDRLGKEGGLACDNVVAWAFTIILITLTLMLFLSTVAPEFMDRIMKMIGL